MPNVSFSLELTARNYDRVRNAIMKMADTSWYRGIIRDTATSVLEDWVRYASSITHKLSGQLAQAHTYTYDSRRSEGHVYINDRIVYRTGRATLRWPKIYGPYEHDRGGSHAFYARTLQDRGHLAESVGMRALQLGVPPA